MGFARVKLDFNNLMRQIDDYFTATRTEANETSVIGMCFGLGLLQSYLKNIAERAIAIDDDELIGLLLDLGIVRKDE